MLRQATKAVGDTVIIGGGVMGSSVAYHLSKIRGTGKGIVVVERDPTYRHASAMLSAGGIRQQFSNPENIALSKFGVDFIKNIHELAVDDEIPDVQFHERGYLYLASEQGLDMLTNNHKVQRECGCDWMEMLSPEKLMEQFPYINPSGIAAGSFGRKNEGSFDPWALLNAMKKRAVANGVQYTQGEVVGAQVEGDHVQAVKVKNSHGEVGLLHGGTFVNAAGPFSSKIVDFCGGFPLPVRPRKRCIFVFHCPGNVPDSAPLVVDTTGVYFRPEGRGQRFICGVCPPEHEDPDCSSFDDLDIVPHHLFEEVIWPTLAERVPAFEALKVQASWAGFYEFNTYDHNGIIGVHPDRPNLFILSGFSGHGLQHSPAAGLAVAELVEYGEHRTFKLDKMSFERIMQDLPLREANIV